MSNQYSSRGTKETLMLTHRPALKAKMFKRIANHICVFALTGVLMSCGGTVIKQGHVFMEEDLQQVKPGMTKDQVEAALGTPDTKSIANNEAYYYISSTSKKALAFMKPEIVDRKVVAIYFDKRGQVQQVANYGLQDGKVVDFVTRKTPAAGGGDEGLIKQLFRNIGSAKPAMTKDY